MSEMTLLSRHQSQIWVAKCPRCGKKTKPKNFPCPNCRKPHFEYFREWHGDKITPEPPLKPVAWTECGLVCTSDNTKLKNFPCPHRCGGYITLNCIKASIMLTYQDLSSARKEWYSVVTLATKFIWAALCYLAFLIILDCVPYKLSRDKTWAIALVLPALWLYTKFEHLTLKLVVPGYGRDKWLSYKK